MQGRVPALLLADLYDLSSSDMPVFPSIKWGHKATTSPRLVQGPRKAMRAKRPTGHTQGLAYGKQLGHRCPPSSCPSW